MNLSDLVHRTAGDNKVSKGTASNVNPNARLDSSSNNPTNAPKSSNNGNNVLQQPIINPSIPSNLFTTFARPDQPFLFAMPNTDWMTNNVFFNGNMMSGNNAHIEPMNTVATPDAPNSVLKQSSAAPNTNNIQPSPQQQQQQRQMYQIPANIAPFPPQFQGFDMSLVATNKPANAAPATTAIATATTAIATATTAVATATNAVVTAITPKTNTSITKTNTSITSSSETMTTTSSPSIAQQQQAPIAPTSSTLARIRSRSKVTGENVTMNNFEEGYIQFVLNHDANFIHDGIESLIYAKRKFQSVPKTGDLYYTTWDIYQLVLKLQHQEIKNWSQLVGQLGLADMAGRPQFAQRVKRWMHRYKIDCYFDYLLGNPFQFHGPAGKYSFCLMMGNYKKRKTDTVTSSTALTTTKFESDLDDEINEDDNEHRTPILLAGSRKRMRDNSRNSLQIIENARQFVRSNQTESEEEEGEEEEDKQSNVANTQTDEDNEEKDMIEEEDDQEKEEEEDQEVDDEQEDVEREEPEEFADEIDELASSSSTPSSPVYIINSSPMARCSPQISKPSPTIAHTPTLGSHVNKGTHSPTINKSSSSPSVNTTPTTKSTPPMSLLSSLPPLLSCSNCIQNDTKVANMEKEILRLKQHIIQLETQAEKENAQIKKLLRLRDRTERWRKQIISDLARGPLVASDNDAEDEDDEEEEEEEEEEDDDDSSP